MARSQSEKCPACNNMVRVDYPSFPYCRFHAGLKDSSQSLVMTHGRGENFTAIRNMLYDPGRTSVPTHESAIGRVRSATQNSGLSSKDVALLISGWGKSTKGINLSSPQECYQAKGKVLSTMSRALEHSMNQNSDFTNPRVGIAECKNSTVMLPDGTMTPLEHNHTIVYGESDSKATIIIDPLPAASLYGVVNDNVDNVFTPGHTMFTDKMVVSSLYEYAGYSSLMVDSIADVKTGQQLWDTQSSLGAGSSDVERQRELISRSRKQNFAPPVYQRSPTPEEWDIIKGHKFAPQGTQQEHHDDGLDALFDL